MLPSVSMFEPVVKVVPLGFYSSTTSPQLEKSEQPSVPKENEPSENVKFEEPVKEQSSNRTKSQNCKVCGKVLSSASSYYVHMKLHSGNKPFQCTICEASFCRKPYLEVHMRTHTGERPFQCNLCLKRFTQKSSLNTHKRVHTGERPYSCDICEKRFAVKSYVTAHRWSHVGGQPLACDHCKMTFSSKHQFAVHIRSHARGPNHTCNLCGRTFVRDSYLIRHQHRVHRDNAGGDQFHTHFISVGHHMDPCNLDSPPKIVPDSPGDKCPK